PLVDGPLLHWGWDGFGWTGPVSLDANLPSADICAVSRDPEHIDVFAIGRDASLQHWPPTGWTNWADTQLKRAAEQFQPTKVDELVAIVERAEKNGLHVRAVGSGWSFTDIMLTPDFMVLTDRLTKTLTSVVDFALNPNGQARKLYHVEGGIT